MAKKQVKYDATKARGVAESKQRIIVLANDLAFLAMMIRQSISMHQSEAAEMNAQRAFVISNELTGATRALME